MIQVSNEQIHRDSPIQDDLGVTGDDAVKLLEAVHERYSTDFSQFPFDDDFGPEGCPPISYFFKWIMGRSKPFKPITVGMLWDAVLHGAWIEPPDGATPS